MRRHYRGRRALALGVLTMLAPVVALAQDSGTGVDLHMGDGLDPTGVSRLTCDPSGTSWLTAERRRTPSGVLYLCPPDRDELRPILSGTWRFSGSFSVGYLDVSGDGRNTNWLRFNDWRDAPVARIDLQLQQPADGRYFDVRGSHVNSDNQYYKLVAGRAGHYKIEGFVRSQPNVTAGQAKSVWDGVGTAYLSLKPGLTPAGSTHAEVSAVSAAAPEEGLVVVRDKQGGGINYFLSRSTTAYASASHESRSGARPFGGPFFFAFIGPGLGGVYETPRPIDDGTVNVNGGLRHTGRVWNIEGGYSGSFYRNGMSTFSYEVPFTFPALVPGFGNVPLRLGEFAYEPDNDYHNVRGRLTRKFSPGSQLSLDASYSTSRQNDELAAPMNCNGQFGLTVPPFLFECGNWNTTAALSQRTADLSIDSLLANARVVTRPTRAVTLQGHVKFNRQDYKGTYVAFNPITGQYGYIAENGAQGSSVPFEMGVWDPLLFPSVLTRVRNLPLDKDILEAGVAADWRVDPKNTLGAALTLTRTDRTNREIEEQTDTLMKVSWTSRAVEDLTLRANYSYLDRSGGAYDYDPYHFTYSTSLPGFVDPGTLPPHTVMELRKYDVGDRRQHKATFIATFALPRAMTFSGSLRGDWNEYDAQLGREGYGAQGASLQWDWQPSERTTANVFFGFDRSSLDVANLNEMAAFGSDPQLGGNAYAEAGRWWVNDVQRNLYAGAMVGQRVARGQIDLGWNYVDSRGLTNYRFDSPDALAYPALAASAGTRFPPMQHRVNTIDVSWSAPLTQRLGLRLFGIHERGRLFDWHYSGLDTGLVLNNRIYLDAGPRDYSVNLVGVQLRVKL